MFTLPVMAEGVVDCTTETTRCTFWQIGSVGTVIFYALAIVAVLIFLYGFYRRFNRYAQAKEDKVDRFDDLPKRIVDAVKIVLSNRKQFYQDLYAGVMHTFIMWGFLTLLIATTILLIDVDITRNLFEFSFFKNEFYLSYSLVADLLGLLFVVGVGMALYKRYARREDRLWHKHTSLEDDLFIWVLFLLGLGGYINEGVRIVGAGIPEFERVSFVGYSIALLFNSGGMTPSIAADIYPAFWWSHALLALAFIASIPYAKPFHMISSFANVVVRDENAKTTLRRVPEDAGPEEIGHRSIEDFSWKELLDQDACTKCGRCTNVCPANASNRPLDPRNVILDLKEYREKLEAGEVEETPIITTEGETVINPESMESCMTCLACMDACPVEIEHVPQFVEMSRRLIESGEADTHVQDAMMDIFQKGNSFGEPERKRPEWTEDLDFKVPDARDEEVEYLWYVGDYPSYDEMNQRVARSLATIFERSGVSYGILYEEERHDGNDVRRVGEEGLYEMLAEDNIATFEQCEFDKVVCTDPHSFNTFENEYEQFGWDGDVYHYTQVIEDLFKEGKLDLNGDELDYTVTYHDPCHLGRYNEEYEAPRTMIEATGCDLYEMPRNRSNSFCCGGGGGGIWMDFDEDPKPSEERLREALEDTDAGSEVEKFVVACPMCNTMYEDGRKTGDYEDEIEVVELSELLREALNLSEAEVRA